MIKTALFLTITVLILEFSGCSNVDLSDPTISEIKAVRELDFQNNKKSAYLRIAIREDLSNQAQVYLVKEVFDNLAFDDSKEHVLLALIDNPSFSTDAEKAILDRMNRIKFNVTKEHLLLAIDANKTNNGL